MATLFIQNKIKFTQTNMKSLMESRKNIENADHVVVTNEWDPHAYIEFGIDVQMNKRIVVLKDDDLIRSAFFPKYKDASYEISFYETFKDYLESLFEVEES